MIKQSILNFFFYLSFPIFLVPLSLTIIFSILLLINTQKLQPHIRIRNFYLVWAWVLLYVLIYILGLVVLRFTQLASERNLRELYYNYKNLFYEHFIVAGLYYKIINLLFVLIILLLWLILIVRAQRFLRHRVWQLYIYYVYKRFIPTKLIQIDGETAVNLAMTYIPSELNMGIAEKWVVKYYRYYSLDALWGNLLDWIDSKCSKRFDIYVVTSSMALKKYLFLRVILFAITPICVAIECWQFNWCVQYIYYYLFFFVFAINYLLIDETIREIYFAVEFVEIILEKNYGYPYVMYVNLTKSEEDLLDFFAACPTKLQKIIPDLKALQIDVDGGIIPGFATTNFIRFTRSFWREETPKGVIYHNLFTGRSFWEKDLYILGDRYFVEDSNEPEALEYYHKLFEEQERRRNL